MVERTVANHLLQRAVLAKRAEAQGEQMRVRLTTGDGLDVLENLAEIPPFSQPPDVLLWGDRVFRLLDLEDGIATYVEAFAFWLPPTPDAQRQPVKPAPMDFYAPPCSQCGELTARSGSCYLCHNCGTSSGCS